jgi:hypothetical protein
MSGIAVKRFYMFDSKQKPPKAAPTEISASRLAVGGFSVFSAALAPILVTSCYPLTIS